MTPCCQVGGCDPSPEPLKDGRGRVGLRRAMSHRTEAGSTSRQDHRHRQMRARSEAFKQPSICHHSTTWRPADQRMFRRPRSVSYAPCSSRQISAWISMIVAARHPIRPCRTDQSQRPLFERCYSLFWMLCSLFRGLGNSWLSRCESIVIQELEQGQMGICLEFPCTSPFNRVLALRRAVCSGLRPQPACRRSHAAWGGASSID